jgi:hypothetical protein
MATELAQLNPVTVGIDVGQIHDPTALSVAEVVRAHTGKFRYGKEHHIPAHVDANMLFHKAQDADPVMRSRYIIRHIERLRLLTSYPTIANYIADMLCNPLFAHRDVRALIDVTGVGRPVYDLLLQEIKRREATRHIQLKPITFTGGMLYNRSTGSLAKAFLVSRLQSLLQSDEIDAPDTLEVRAMLDELKVYEIKVSDDGKDTYGAIVGKHDDLATSLGLACLEDPYSERVRYSARVY